VTDRHCASEDTSPRHRRDGSRIAELGSDDVCELIASSLEHIPDMVFVKDAKTFRFVYVNRASEEVLGRPRKDVLARTDYELFPARDAAYFREKDRDVVVRGSKLDIPEEHVPTDSGIRVLHTKKTAILGTDGEPLYLLGLSQDITDRRHLSRDLLDGEGPTVLERLHDSIRAREDLLALVSHDLRNPLNTILMSAERLARSVASEESARELARIRRAGAFMSDLIGNLVDAAAFDGGLPQLERGPRSVSAILDEAMDLLLPLASARHQQLEQSVVGRVADVDCDRALVLQVLSNLVGNAIKFTPDGGRIRISAGSHEDNVCFTVSDSGPGISSAALPHVFDRYWQANHSHRASAGLGLYIVKGIVNAHGGIVWAERSPLGGAAVSFTLPSAPER
jgi:PAS domain S-box-containing protein